jgi:hypothetical protein
LRSSGRGCACRRSKRGVALFEHRKRDGVADELVTRARGQHAEGVVDVTDATVAVAADDHVALRGKETLGALFGLPEFPIAVGEILGEFA